MKTAKRNAAPVDQTVAAVDKSVVAAALPVADFNMDQQNGQAQFLISDFLLEGRGSALKVRELKKLTGLKGRTIRLLVHRERLSGAAIISDNAMGFWLSEDPVEIRRCSAALFRRASQILRVSAALSRTAARIEKDRG